MQPPSEANGPRLISDEEVQRFRLDKVAPHNAPITLADYDPGWPALFAREAARIRAALGGRAVQVEHVGSTSVPGLAAKPIIDILLVVPDSSDEQAYVLALDAAGYVLSPRAGLVRAPHVQRPGHRYQPARVHRRCGGDRPDAAVPGPAPGARRRP